MAVFGFQFGLDMSSTAGTDASPPALQKKAPLTLFGSLRLRFLNTYYISNFAVILSYLVSGLSGRYMAANSVPYREPGTVC